MSVTLLTRTSAGTSISKIAIQWTLPKNATGPHSRSTWPARLSKAHVGPLKPGGHWQANASIPSTHVALLRHGSDEHSSTSYSHCKPENPVGQLQLNHPKRSNESSEALHDPPFKHGLLLHGCATGGQVIGAHDPPQFTIRSCTSEQELHSV